MSSPSPYSYVCSDNVLDTFDGEREFSTSTSPGVTDAFNSNVNLVESYVPWKNLETNGSFEPEGMSDFGTGLEDPEWDYQQASIFPASDMAYQDAIGNSELWSNPSPQQSFKGSSIQNEPAHMEQGRAIEDYSSLNLEEDEQEALLEIAMPATHSTTSDESPSPKRRKSSTTSASSPTEDYRKGHNAIEKRYRSNLNAKILSLEQCLPIQEIADEEDLGPQRKTKSAILTRAVKHIEFLKQNTRRLTKETEDLNRKFRALEKLTLGMGEKEGLEVAVEEKKKKNFLLKLM